MKPQSDNAPTLVEIVFILRLVARRYRNFHHAQKTQRSWWCVVCIYQSGWDFSSRKLWKVQKNLLSLPPIFSLSIMKMRSHLRCFNISAPIHYAQSIHWRTVFAQCVFLWLFVPNTPSKSFAAPSGLAKFEHRFYIGFNSATLPIEQRCLSSYSIIFVLWISNQQTCDCEFYRLSCFNAIHGHFLYNSRPRVNNFQFFTEQDPFPGQSMDLSHYTLRKEVYE